jgi:hypothetical protein
VVAQLICETETLRSYDVVVLAFAGAQLLLIVKLTDPPPPSGCPPQEIARRPLAVRRQARMCMRTKERRFMTPNERGASHGRIVRSIRAARQSDGSVVAQVPPPAMQEVSSFASAP